MKIKIYQISPDRFRTCKYTFAGSEFAKENGFTLDDYDLVYELTYTENISEIPNYSMVTTENEKLALLEEIFKQFNIARPEDFHGHSLSVSDVVALDDELYYCDDMGWTKL